MPQYDFYFEAKEKNKTVLVELTEQEEKQRQNDYQSIKNQKAYQRAHHARWLLNGSLYNLTQEPLSGDAVSNFYLGMARSSADASISSMTQGVPSFSFDPKGPVDDKIAVIWEAGIESNLQDNNFFSKNRDFITDTTIFGGGCFEVSVNRPYRKRRVMKAGGTLEEKIVRNFLQPKVVVRNRPIWQCYRNANVLDRTEVPTGGFTDSLTRNQFVQNYMNSYQENGKNKYKNLDKIAVASHYKLEHYYDELQDAYRIYVLPYGDTPEGKPLIGNEDELGIPILDYPMTISRYFEKVDGREVQVSCGLNVHGMVPLAFGTFADKLDVDYKTHDLYGMGLPELIEVPEQVANTLLNMTIDNLRLKNTVLIGYKGYDGTTSLDMSVPKYSGEYVDGEVNPQPLGTADVASNQVMWDWMKTRMVAGSGINDEQLIGDADRTAFQASLRAKQTNQRARDRITSLEEQCYDRLGTIMLSTFLPSITEREYESMTMSEAKSIAERIKNKELTAEDYEFEGGNPVKKSKTYMIKVPGRKFREDLKINKGVRKLDYNSTENTLIEDDTLPGDASYVPAVEKYLLPTGDISDILEFRVKSDGSGMISDERFQDIQSYKETLTMALELKNAGYLKDKDIDALFDALVDFMGIEPDDINMSKREESEQMQMAKDLLQQMKEGVLSQGVQSVQAQGGNQGSGSLPGGGQVPNGANVQSSLGQQQQAPSPPQLLESISAGAL